MALTPEQRAAWASWPELLRLVAEDCGEQVALAFAAAFGGRELYVPTPERIDEGHPMARALGVATARKVASTLGGGKQVIPLGPVSTVQRRKRAIRDLKGTGMKNPAIARALGIHTRTVEIRLQRDREGQNPDQLHLFDE